VQNILTEVRRGKRDHWETIAYRQKKKLSSNVEERTEREDRRTYKNLRKRESVESSIFKHMIPTVQGRMSDF